MDETRDEWNEFKKEWDKESVKYNFERLSVFAGEDESQINFGWYTKTSEKPVIRVSKFKNMTIYTDYYGTVDPLYFYNSKIYNMDDYIIRGDRYYTNKVTVTDIEPNSHFFYQRKMYGQWENPIELKTYDPKNFKFIFMGDPQIGGSHNHYTRSNNYNRTLSQEEGTRNDAFNWKRALERSVSYAENPSLVLTAGDQADSMNYGTADEIVSQETQYSAYLYPPLMQQIPFVNCVGNHEANTENYRNHFNMPHPFTDFKNQDTWTSSHYSKGWTPGYSYYLKYNNVLVVVLETNYGTCSDFKELIHEATETYPEADWRIVMFHHDMFGIGSTHSQQSDIMRIRKCLTRLFTEYQIDLVINGHDHVYTASNFVTYVPSSNDFTDYNDYDTFYEKYKDTKSMVPMLGEGFYEVTEIKEDVVNENPKGTLYITANCSSGSKFLDFESKDKEYVYNFKQTFTSTFGILEFKWEGDIVKLIINVYEVDTYNVVDGPFILQKNAKNPELELPTSTQEPTIISTQEPQTTTQIQTQEPQSTTQTQEPQSTTQTQEPQSTTQTQEPQTTTQTQEPQTTTQTQEPQINTQTQEPQTITQTQEPQTATQTQELQSTTQESQPTQTQEPDQEVITTILF